MRRASYREAIAWIVDNDDTEWVHDSVNRIQSVTAALVSDLFGVPDEKVYADLKRKLEREVKK